LTATAADSRHTQPAAACVVDFHDATSSCGNPMPPGGACCCLLPAALARGICCEGVCSTQPLDLSDQLWYRQYRQYRQYQQQLLLHANQRHRPALPGEDYNHERERCGNYQLHSRCCCCCCCCCCCSMHHMLGARSVWQLWAFNVFCRQLGLREIRPPVLQQLHRAHKVVKVGSVVAAVCCELHDAPVLHHNAPS